LRRVVSLVAAAVVAGSVLVPSGAAQAVPRVAPNVIGGTVVLKNVSTLRCIDDSSGYGLRDFGCQAPGPNLAYQEFTANPDPSFTYDILKNVKTGRCIDDSTAYGLRDYPCQNVPGPDAPYQEFTVTMVNGYAVFRNAATQNCIDDSLGYGLRDFPCQNQTGPNGPYQQFILEVP
jgi:hypothetical protein